MPASLDVEVATAEPIIVQGLDKAKPNACKLTYQIGDFTTLKVRAAKQLHRLPYATILAIARELGCSRPRLAKEAAEEIMSKVGLTDEEVQIVLDGLSEREAQLAKSSKKKDEHDVDCQLEEGGAEEQGEPDVEENADLTLNEDVADAVAEELAADNYDLGDPSPEDDDAVVDELCQKVGNIAPLVEPPNALNVVPPGCRLKLVLVRGASPKWHGTLPPGCRWQGSLTKSVSFEPSSVGQLGSENKNRRGAISTLTELQAQLEVLEWLWAFHRFDTGQPSHAFNKQIEGLRAAAQAEAAKRATAACREGGEDGKAGAAIPGSSSGCGGGDGGRIRSSSSGSSSSSSSSSTTASSSSSSSISKSSSSSSSSSSRCKADSAAASKATSVASSSLAGNCSSGRTTATSVASLGGLAKRPGRTLCTGIQTRPQNKKTYDNIFDNTFA